LLVKGKEVDVALAIKGHTVSRSDKLLAAKRKSTSTDRESTRHKIHKRKTKEDKKKKASIG
jgi:hypothetical protein